MVKFLINRPIAVIMVFVALGILGVLSYRSLPVSLLPSVDIPVITVKINSSNLSARQLENTVTSVVRHQLQQLDGLSEIQSHTQEGSATISLEFNYGVDMGLAFIAANEKIDAAMPYLPREIERPKVIKGNVTDIPLVYLYITPKRDKRSQDDFLQMAYIAENVVKRRLEQLPEISMVDMSGVPDRAVYIIPDKIQIEGAGISHQTLGDAVSRANQSPGSMAIKDGAYEFNVSVVNNLRTPQEIASTYFRHGNRVMRLGDVADIKTDETNNQGIIQYNGKRAVALAIIKHQDDNMEKLKASLAATIDSMKKDYPDYEFTTARNQTELLEYTISNLKQNLILGLVLLFLLTWLLIADSRIPVIMALTVSWSLILSFILFYLFKISINIISLSGLIIAVGMMIDNSVIVTENIMQWQQKGLSISQACVKGTNEMITPLLSSSLTTMAVFIPLIFMSGMAGALFTDQAFSISAGLIAAYIVGIVLLPVLYNLTFTKINIHRSLFKRDSLKSDKSSGIDRFMIRAYNKGIDFIFRHKVSCVVGLCLILSSGGFILTILPVDRLPEIDHVESTLRIEWNENIGLAENIDRVNNLISSVEQKIVESSSAIGLQDFLLCDEGDLAQSDTEIYLRAFSKEGLDSIKLTLKSIILDTYPLAAFEFSPPVNVFEKVFSSSKADLEVHLMPKGKIDTVSPETLFSINQKIVNLIGEPSSEPALNDQLELVIDYSKLAIYDIAPEVVVNTIRSAINDQTVTTLSSFTDYLPVIIKKQTGDMNEILSHTMIHTRKSQYGNESTLPLSQVVSLKTSHNFRDIVAGKNGEYFPLVYQNTATAQEAAAKVEHRMNEEVDWLVEITGAFIESQRMMNEMTLILIASVVLMYFILCAQFESFLQPLIVLIEIPLDVAFALFTLWITGYSLNIMSAIGIIVTCGIVVNDSILKIDAINSYRAEGIPLVKAIHIAGERRLRPIIMTSLTTILAMLPILFTSDMGSQLQRPLAVAMIGSMTVGTLISIFIIPLVYYLIYRKHEN